MPPTVAKHCKESKEPQEFPIGRVEQAAGHIYNFTTEEQPTQQGKGS